MVAKKMVKSLCKSCKKECKQLGDALVLVCPDYEVKKEEGKDE